MIWGLVLREFDDGGEFETPDRGTSCPPEGVRLPDLAELRWAVAPHLLKCRPSLQVKEDIVDLEVQYYL